MTWLLERKLKSLAKKTGPEPRFVRILEKRLKTEIGHPLWWIGSWKWTVSIATAVSLVGSATGAYAYTSDDVLPDHPLYALRKTMEKVEEVAVAVNPEVKAHVQAKNLERRLHERTLQKAQNKKIAKEDVQDFVTHLDSLVEASGKLSAPAQEKLKQKEASLEEKQEALMKEAGDDDEVIKAQMQKINLKIKELNGRRKARLEKRAKGGE